MDGIDAGYDKVKSVEVKPGVVVITVARDFTGDVEISISRDAVARIAREMAGRPDSWLPVLALWEAEDAASAEPPQEKDLP